MAHNNYHCCAICDDKLGYSQEARPKEDICLFCRKQLEDNYNLKLCCYWSLTAWMRKEKLEQVIAILDNLGFRKCQYPNTVDELYDEIRTKVEGR